MITLLFLKTWLKITALAGLAGVIEWYAIHNLWWRYGALALSAVVFAGLTVVMFQDWKHQRAAGGRYQYTMLNDVSHERR